MRVLRLRGVKGVLTMVAPNVLPNTIKAAVPCSMYLRQLAAFQDHAAHDAV